MAEKVIDKKFLSLDEQVIEEYVGRVSGIEGVEEIYIHQDDDEVNFYTVIPDIDMEVEEEISKREFEILDLIPDVKDTYRYDFFLIHQSSKMKDSIIKKYDLKKIYP